MTTGPRSDERFVLAFVCVTAFAIVLNGTMLPFATARASAQDPPNPLHAGAGYSDAYLALAVPLVLALLAATKLRGAGKKRSSVYRQEPVD